MILKMKLSLLIVLVLVHWSSLLPLQSETLIQNQLGYFEPLKNKSDTEPNLIGLRNDLEDPNLAPNCKETGRFAMYRECHVFYHCTSIGARPKFKKCGLHKVFDHRTLMCRSAREVVCDACNLTHPLSHGETPKCFHGILRPVLCQAEDNDTSNPVGCIKPSQLERIDSDLIDDGSEFLTDKDKGIENALSLTVSETYSVHETKYVIHGIIQPKQTTITLGPEKYKPSNNGFDQKSNRYNRTASIKLESNAKDKLKYLNWDDSVEYPGVSDDDDTEGGDSVPDNISSVIYNGKLNSIQQKGAKINNKGINNDNPGSKENSNKKYASYFVTNKNGQNLIHANKNKVISIQSHADSKKGQQVHKDKLANPVTSNQNNDSSQVQELLLSKESNSTEDAFDTPKYSIIDLQNDSDTYKKAEDTSDEGKPSRSGTTGQNREHSAESSIQDNMETENVDENVKSGKETSGLETHVINDDGLEYTNTSTGGKKDVSGSTKKHTGQKDGRSVTDSESKGNQEEWSTSKKPVKHPSKIAEGRTVILEDNGRRVPLNSNDSKSTIGSNSGKSSPIDNSQLHLNMDRKPKYSSSKQNLDKNHKIKESTSDRGYGKDTNGTTGQERTYKQDLKVHTNNKIHSQINQERHLNDKVKSESDTNFKSEVQNGATVNNLSNNKNDSEVDTPNKSSETGKGGEQQAGFKWPSDTANNSGILGNQTLNKEFVKGIHNVDKKTSNGERFKTIGNSKHGSQEISDQNKLSFPKQVILKMVDNKKDDDPAENSTPHRKKLASITITRESLKTVLHLLAEEENNSSVPEYSSPKIEKDQGQRGITRKKLEGKLSHNQLSLDVSLNSTYDTGHRNTEKVHEVKTIAVKPEFIDELLKIIENATDPNNSHHKDEPKSKTGSEAAVEIEIDGDAAEDPNLEMKAVVRSVRALVN